MKLWVMRSCRETTFAIPKSKIFTRGEPSSRVVWKRFSGFRSR
jgi:hypothetical protein